MKISIFSDPNPTPFVEHFRRRYLRGEIDLQIAEMLTGNYRDREMAGRPRTLVEIPRPKPVKSSGTASVVLIAREGHGR